MPVIRQDFGHFFRVLMIPTPSEFSGASFGVNDRRERILRTSAKTSGTWTGVIPAEHGEEIPQAVDFTCGQNFGEAQPMAALQH